MRCISIVRSLYFKIFSASLLLLLLLLFHYDRRRRRRRYVVAVACKVLAFNYKMLKIITWQANC